MKVRKNSTQDDCVHRLLTSNTTRMLQDKEHAPCNSNEAPPPPGNPYIPGTPYPYDPNTPPVNYYPPGTPNPFAFPPPFPGGGQSGAIPGVTCSNRGAANPQNLPSCEGLLGSGSAATPLSVSFVN